MKTTHMSVLLEEYDDPQDDLSCWNTSPSDGSLLEGPFTRSTADTGPGDDPPRHMSALVEEYDDPQDDLSRWNTSPSDGSLLEGPLTRSTADTGPGDDFPRLNMARRDGFEGPLASNDKSDTARIEPTPPLVQGPRPISFVAEGAHSRRPSPLGNNAVASSSSLQVGRGDWRCPLALPLITPDEMNNEQGECREFVSSHRLSRSFQFHSVYDGQPMHPADIWPVGPNMLVKVNKLHTLMSSSVVMTTGQLRSIIDGHGVFVPFRCPKQTLVDLIAGHTCETPCPSVQLIFRPLKRARAFAEEHSGGVSKTARPMSAKAKGKQRAVNATHPVMGPPTATVTVNKETCDPPAFPHVATEKQKLKIIKEWQTLMDFDDLTMQPCAVCSQSMARRDTHYALPEEVDFSLLQNNQLPFETLPTTYNMKAYDDAILNPTGLHDLECKGPIDMCSSCYSSIVERKKQPLNSIANFQYYAHDELPQTVKDAFAKASMFDLMMVSRARATRLTHLFSKKKGGAMLGSKSSESQRYCKGNVAVLPQDSLNIREFLPPNSEEIRECMCALFLGSDIVPTRENIANLHPIMVTKDVIETIIRFLIASNSWYSASGVQFSPTNTNALYDESDTDSCRSAIPAAVELCHLPDNKKDDDTQLLSDGYADREVAFDGGHNRKLAMEAVGYTTGDYTPKNYRLMKAKALAWCLAGNETLVSASGSQLLNDHDPGLMSFLFPSLDPWGIGDFCDSRRRPDQFISFDRQVQNLLKQYDSPFQRDPNFAYICWNIIQKRAVNRQVTFRTNATAQSEIAHDLQEAAPELARMVTKWETNAHTKPSTKGEKKAVRTLNKLKLVAKEVKGSSGYKQCRRNEIRALMKKFSTPALFVTLNPSDVNHPLVGVMAGIDPAEWRAMDYHERAEFLARNPGPAAQFFDFMIKGFLDVVVRYDDAEGGLFGHCKAYYGMVEAQGRGTLHCHMLIWLEGNPSPQELRDRMNDDPVFKTNMFSWLESLIKCELPGTTEVQSEINGKLERPSLPQEAADPRIAPGPMLTEENEDSFAAQFTQFVSELATACNWHTHSFTCWKHLKKGEPGTDSNCRMRIDGSTQAITELDPDTMSILLRRLHPRINNFNDVVIFLMRCNMDIKYIGSGEAAKALVYYISDYITKNTLATHVGLEALSYAIRQNDAKYMGIKKSTSRSDQQKSLFTKTVNAIMVRQETSHQQIMSYCVGGGDVYTSHKFRLLRYYDFDRIIRKELNEKAWYPYRDSKVEVEEEPTLDNSNTGDERFECTTGMDFDMEMVDDEADGGPSISSMSDGKAREIPSDEYPEHGNDDDESTEEILIRVEHGTVMQTDEVKDYMLRSNDDAFNNLSVWDYTATVTKFNKSIEDSRLAHLDSSTESRPEPNSTPPRRVGKRAFPRGQFLQPHEQRDSHISRIREVEFVPVILGPALPRPDRGGEEYEHWCRSMLILFKPWRIPSDLRGGHRSWASAFDNFNAPARATSIMHNIDAERECEDAKKKSEQRRNSGSATDNDNFEFTGNDTDLDSLAVLLRNDTRLNDDDFEPREGLQTAGMHNRTSEIDRIIADADRNGIFSTNRLKDWKGRKPEGTAREIRDGDEELINMHITLMSELKKQKRPAPAPTEDLGASPIHGRKKKKIEPLMSMTELEERVEVSHIKVRDESSPDPLEEMEAIIEDTGIEDNPEQERAFRIAAEHFARGDEEQLFLYVMGIGGSGKSYVINALVELFKRCGVSEQMLLSAPTGCAAILIGGYTIHALTFLPVSKYPPNYKNLEQIWHLVKYLVIDEISMISAPLLSQISRRMCTAKAWDPIASSKPFGAVNVIFTGDFGQLTPVKSYSLFSHELVSKLGPNVQLTEDGQSSLHGAFLWRQVNRVVELKKNWRAKEDPQFVNLLQRIRSGIAWKGHGAMTEAQMGTGSNYHKSDFDTLNERRLDVLKRRDPQSLKNFTDAPIVVANKVLRDRLNSKMATAFASSTRQEVQLYHARDRYKKVALLGLMRHHVWQVDSRITNDNLGCLPLVPGMRVIVTDNASMTAKVVNGSQGILRDVKYDLDDEGNRYAVCAYVHIPGSRLQAPQLEYEVVPILPIRTNFTYRAESPIEDDDRPDNGKGGKKKNKMGISFNISRLQLPLLPAYAFSDYKIQGQSLTNIIIDLQGCRSLQSAYVMLSRAKSLKGVAIMRWFDPGKIYKALPQQFRDEFLRLHNLDEATKLEFNNRTLPSVDY